MRILALSIGWTLIIDFLAWLIFHLGIAWLTLLLPDRFFQTDTWFYRSKSWEKNGQTWDQIFGVKKWKERLPDGAAFFKSGYQKKRLATKTTQNLATFILETRRAELTHWLAILPAPLFFLWNPVWAGWFMIGYALVANAPFIIVQRYNRPRFIRILNRQKSNETN